MNRTTTIVLFAGIFAIAVGTLGISGNSALLMASAVPQAVEPMGVLGHVEYMVRDSGGNVIKYMQGDNEVVNSGEDCVAELVFGIGGCVGGVGSFTFVGIGNGTSGTVDATNQTLADALDNGEGICATDAVLGDMARRDAVVGGLQAASGATGTILTLDTSTLPFTFDASNATTVYDSGIFNADYGTPAADDKCGGANNSGIQWDMFARQLLNTNQGITVTPGDSLSVKWTITVG